LDVECKKLENNGANLARHAEQWVELVQQMNHALKVSFACNYKSRLFKIERFFQEIGDVENWSKAIEEDISVISNVLKNVHKGKPFIRIKIISIKVYEN
jgi:hypothetical protein